ncbi:CDP-diacylglycerol--glycerol-3-phosphate 3-phosphatidyltransferase [uncultured Finegoldia sp.]|uniref:CDP-diacylglycerol--glycerol-3-phosphate 3-phosphatidyltransferase n=1 Tax=uncultured Finegoldia sp. TaxID=328009 RepID=UPI002628BEED|nr:CDP-diacylglycerol--glycerol-3-phosphate 3-phosphatidyltransferase [uncultured Finegoldia sp.]
MNIANKFTTLRIILIPFFVISLLIFKTENYIPAAIFIISAITDFIDGQLARRKNLVTTFGKFMDPLADKMLSCSALIVLIQLDIIPAWSVVIVVLRELTISGFRILAASNGVTLAASLWGKSKTMTQFISIVLILVNINDLIGLPIDIYLYYISIVLTIISLVDYIYKNKNVLDLKNI